MTHNPSLRNRAERLVKQICDADIEADYDGCTINERDMVGRVQVALRQMYEEGEKHGREIERSVIEGEYL